MACGKQVMRHLGKARLILSMARTTVWGFRPCAGCVFRWAKRVSQPLIRLNGSR